MLRSSKYGRDILYSRLFTYSLLFFNDTATPEIYTYGHTLSLHDARPIWRGRAATRSSAWRSTWSRSRFSARRTATRSRRRPKRSEEHPSELQSLMRNSYAVFCLTKKNITTLLTPND